MKSGGQKGGGEEWEREREREREQEREEEKHIHAPHLTSSDFPDLDIALCYGFTSLTCQDITSHRAQL